MFVPGQAVVTVEVAETPCGATVPNTNMFTWAGLEAFEQPVVAFAYEMEYKVVNKGATVAEKPLMVFTVEPSTLLVTLKVPFESVPDHTVK